MEIAKETVKEIKEHWTDKGLLENVSPEGEFSDTPTGRIVNPGHSMEAAWFVISEGVLTGNTEAIAFGKKIIDLTLPLGWDKENSGIIAFTDINGNPPVQLEWDMKLWWPQCETMIAARLAYLLFKEEKYNKLYEDLKVYCEKYFIDNEDGEWYGYWRYRVDGYRIIAQINDNKVLVIVVKIDKREDIYG